VSNFGRALDVRNTDVVGFSLGGMIAQQLAFEYPDMIRRMILMGTGPRGGEGMTFTELSTDLLADPVALLMSAFFTPSEASKAAGQACGSGIPTLARAWPAGSRRCLHFGKCACKRQLVPSRTSAGLAEQKANQAVLVCRHYGAG
jgi:pimeloyl-ACP methyl ester carboxylesterase